MEWSTIGGESAVVGYNAGGAYFHNHRSAGYDTVGYDVSCAVDIGKAAFKRQTHMNTIHEPLAANPAIVAAAQTCQEMEEQDRQIFLSRHLTAIMDGAGPCPCTSTQANTDPSYTFDDVAGCYNGPEEKGESRLGEVTYFRVCCYAANG